MMPMMGAGWLVMLALFALGALAVGAVVAVLAYAALRWSHDRRTE